MEINNYVGARINTMLKRRRITKKVLAERIHVTESTLSRWVNGTRQPCLKNISKISEFLCVPTDYLLGTVDDYSIDYDKEFVRRDIDESRR